MKKKTLTKMFINLISVLLLILTVSGCSFMQPDVVYPQAIQRDIFKPVEHKGRTAVVSGNETAIQKNYFMLFDNSVEIPTGYTVENSSTEDTLKFKIINEESNAVVEGMTMHPDITISENDILFDSVDYVVGELYGEEANVGVFDYGTPVKHGNYFYTVSTLNNNATLALIVNRDIVLILNTPNDITLLNSIINELLNPQPQANELSTLPETYTRVMGGFYYTADDLGVGEFNVYALDDTGSSVQVFDANMLETFSMYLVQSSFAYEYKTTITLNKDSHFYASKDVALEKVQ